MRTPKQKAARKEWDAVNIKKVRDARRTYQDANRELVNARNREHYRKHPQKHRNSQLQRSFGISLEDYNEMFKRQKGRCAVCKTHQSELNRALAVDHDHNTGEVRGLLCHHCNVGLGHFKDDPGLLRKAIQYMGGNK